MSLGIQIEVRPPSTATKVDRRASSIVDAHDEFYVHLFTRETKWSSAEPNEDEAARWARIECLVQEITADTPGYDPSRFRILDLGCGRGWLTHLLSRHGLAEGVEPVAQVVEHARQLFPKLNFLAGDAHNVLDLPDFEPYDLVVCSEVLEHVPDSQKAGFAHAVARLLKPGGGLILTTPRGEVLREWTYLNGDPSQPVEDWLSETRVARLFNAQGFRPRRLERVWFDTATRAFVHDESKVGSNRLLALYQVWALHLRGSLFHSLPQPKSEPEAVLAEFHLACQKAASRALEVLPDHPVLLKAQAETLLGLGDSQEARRILARTAALHADDAAARRLFAAVLRLLGSHDESAAHALRAATLEELSTGVRRTERFSFVDHLAEGTLQEGNRNQLELRTVVINGLAGPCIYLHPPAQLRFLVPASRAGHFTTAIAIQPEAWHKPNSGGCEFAVFLNGREVFRKAINPTLTASDRCWHDLSIEVPGLAIGQHEFVLATRAIGSPPDFRWALWRQPAFA